MEITPIKKVNAVEQVFEQLQSLLIEGEWKPGDKIPSENELAETFGVSRMTIRQAMQKLKALGLIETRTGSGSFVREVTADDSLQDLIPLMYIGSTTQVQVFQFREMIDTESVRLATPLVTENDLARVDRILEQMKKDAAKDDVTAFSRHDLKFHMKLVELSGNPLMIRAYQILLPVLSDSMHSVIEKMKFTPALDYHARILEAMKEKDPDKAEQLMREHIRVNYDYFQ